MIYWDVEFSKRGVKCTVCGELVEKGKPYFVYFNYDKTYKFPLTKKFCSECVKKVYSIEFLTFLKNLGQSIIKLKDSVTNLPQC